MKTSMITVVCMLAAGAFASPVAQNKGDVAKRDAAVVNRDITDTLSSLPVVNGLPDLTSLPNLSIVASLVTQVVNVVKNVEATLSGSHGQGIEELLPGITQELTVLNSTVAGLQDATSGISGTLYDVLTGLGLQTLLARVFSSISTMLTQLSSQIPAGTPGSSQIFTLLQQINQSLGSISDLSNLSS
jgi:hypothetical protein